MAARTITHVTITHVTLFAAAGAALVSAGLLAAAPPPTPQAIIQARQAGFKKMGGAMKALGEQVKADAPARPVMLAAAQTIAAAAREQGRMFPPGTGASAGVKTDALPAIWSDKANFDAQMARLVVESGKLATVAAGGDLDAIRLQAKATGAVCGGCHRQFRADT